IRAGLQQLSEVLKRRAWEFKDTPMVGRTHGVHAEPITFGVKLANWYSETKRNIARFQSAAEDMRVGKFSGAVGTFAHLSPELEEKICSRLGLRAAAVSSQVIQRDRHAAYLATLAVIASTLDKIATEIRHLQRTEIREVEEYFSEKQKGSSAMPHKRNPVTCEQISGLARVVRSNAQAGFENVPLWHERDISHSSVERVIIPDSTTLVDYLLLKTTSLIDTMFVYPARMQKNLDSTGGLVFSGQLLLDLVEHGVSREDAYRMVQSHAMHAWKEGLDFNEASGPCLTRSEGNDDNLRDAAIRNAQAVGAGHMFVLILRHAFPINLLNAVQNVPEVCSIFCATANPVEVVVAKTEQGRGVMGVIDGSSPKGVEGPAEIAARKEFLRKIGYKR